jgi:cytochrome c oxidase subunit 3
MTLQTTKKLYNRQGHPFHIVEPSPWPFTGACAALTISVGAVSYMHHYIGGGLLLSLGFIQLITCLSFWLLNIFYEACYQGNHTREVRRGIRLGFYLFLVSESMFFFSLFWSFLYFSINPSVWIVTWPPRGIDPVNVWGFPLLNTGILLVSGVTLTYSHISFQCEDLHSGKISLYLTCLLGWLFASIQYVEYVSAPFTIADSVYGSCFYLMTGCHGVHVLGGTTALCVCNVLFEKDYLLYDRHVSLELAILYWHFVDIVWLLLFSLIYFWGS